MEKNIFTPETDGDDSDPDCDIWMPPVDTYPWAEDPADEDDTEGDGNEGDGNDDQPGAASSSKDHQGGSDQKDDDTDRKKMSQDACLAGVCDILIAQKDSMMQMLDLIERAKAAGMD